ncbi:hypothetical protein A8E80_08465 [Burkholderia cenocepacia]|nr:hypothetical protein A8E80_08465 [Burkholderia cenocepacia]
MDGRVFALLPIAIELSPNANALSVPSPFALIFTYALLSGTTARVSGPLRLTVTGPSCLASAR